MIGASEFNGKWKAMRAARVSDMDPNSCAWESSRSQFSHALGFKSKSIHYHKIITYEEGSKLENRINEFKEIDFLALVINFVDILGHSRSESNILQEMVPDESAYRKAICSWLER